MLGNFHEIKYGLAAKLFLGMVILASCVMIVGYGGKVASALSVSTEVVVQPPQVVSPVGTMIRKDRMPKIVVRAENGYLLEVYEVEP